VPPSPESVPDEPAFGASAAGRATNDSLRALSKAARMLALYDAHNDAIRRFVADYRATMEKVLRDFGDMELEIRPFEVLRAGDVVHREKDREKSLAFRLYRDGIRRLVVEKRASWVEQLQLLKVLSVRFAGVRQQEEDAVTMLSACDFKAISFEAVSGLVARDDDEEGAIDDGGGGMRPDGDVAGPTEWDLPLPAPLGRTQTAQAPVGDAELERLRAEEASATLPARAVRMLREVVRSESPDRDLVAMAEEIRDFLLVEGTVANLRDMATALAEAPGPERFAPVVAVLGQEPSLAQLLSRVPASEPHAPAELCDLLGHAAGTLPRLLDHFASKPEWVPLRELIVFVARGGPDAILPRIPAAAVPIARRLHAMFVEAAPARALESATLLAARSEPDLQLLALACAAGMPPCAAATELALKLLGAPSPRVRVKAVAALVHLPDPRAFKPLAKFAEESVDSTAEAEAEALGMALGLSSPEEAGALFARWVHPGGGFVGRLRRGNPVLVRAAAAGLGVVPGKEAAALLKEIDSRADEDLHRCCLRSGVLRKKRGLADG